MRATSWPADAAAIAPGDQPHDTRSAPLTENPHLGALRPTSPRWTSRPCPSQDPHTDRGSDARLSERLASIRRLPRPARRAPSPRTAILPRVAAQTLNHYVNHTGPLCFLSCASHTVEEERMKESYSEGVANHADPESCGGDRKVAVEAFDRGTCGPAIEPRNERNRGADAVIGSGRPHWTGRRRKTWTDPARSKNLCTHGTSSSGNWEIPHLATAAPTAVVRTENLEGRMR